MRGPRETLTRPTRCGSLSSLRFPLRPTPLRVKSNGVRPQHTNTTLMNKSQATSRMTIFVTSTICFIICLFVSLFGVFGIILSTMHSKARGHSIKEFFFFFFFLFSYASNITSIYYRLTRAFLATPLPPPLSISPPLRTCSTDHGTCEAGR